MPSTSPMNRIRSVLNTGDFERDFRAWIVAGVATLVIVICLLLTIQDVLSRHFVVAASIFVCPAVLFYALWRLFYHEDLNSAALVTVMAMFIASALVLVLSGGRATGPYVFQPIILLTAVILLSPRLSLAFAIAIIIVPLIGFYLTTIAVSFPIAVDDGRALLGLVRMSTFTSLLCFGCMYLYNKSSILMRTRLVKAQKLAEQANDDIRVNLIEKSATAKLLSKLQAIGNLRGWWYDPGTNLVHHTFGSRKAMNDYDLSTEGSRNTDISPAEQTLIAKLMEPGESWDEEVQIADSAGNNRWYRAIGEVDRNGTEVKQVLGVFQDISDIKELQARNTQSQKMESIGTLASGIAHEINTPIQFVSDNLTFLNDSFCELRKSIEAIASRVAPDTDEDPSTLPTDIRNELATADIEYFFEELPRALAESAEGLSRIKSIVTAMKNFAHPGDAKKSMVNLNDAISSTLVVCANRCRYSAEVVTDYNSQLPLTECVPDDINQAILNIVVNAADSIQEKIDAGLTKRGQIAISTTFENGFIEIRISDTGMGIPEAIKDRIFDPFFTTKEVGKGTGQGLAITYDVVTNHLKGQLYCESEPGKGTTFRIRLPIVAASTAENVVAA